MLQTEWEYLLPKEKRRDDLLNGVPQIPIVCAEKVQREADPLFSLYFFFFFSILLGTAHEIETCIKSNSILHAYHKEKEPNI